MLCTHIIIWSTISVLLYLYFSNLNYVNYLNNLKSITLHFNSGKALHCQCMRPGTLGVCAPGIPKCTLRAVTSSKLPGGASQIWSCTHAWPNKFQTPPKHVVPCQQNCPLNTFLACFPYKMLTPKQVLIFLEKKTSYEMTPKTRWTDILNNPFSWKLLFLRPLSRWPIF